MDIDVLLCDHAQVAGDKLFISGGNIDRMTFPAGTPAPYVAHFAVAGVVHVPWTATNAEHALDVEIVTQDGQAPLLGEGERPEGPVGGGFVFNVGRPPHLLDGENQMVPFAFGFAGLPLAQPGRYVVRLSLDGAPMREMPFTIAVEGAGTGRAPSFGPATPGPL